MSEQNTQCESERHHPEHLYTVQSHFDEWSGVLCLYTSTFIKAYISPKKSHKTASKSFSPCPHSLWLLSWPVESESFSDSGPPWLMACHPSLTQGGLQLLSGTGAGSSGISYMQAAWKTLGTLKELAQDQPRPLQAKADLWSHMIVTKTNKTLHVNLLSLHHSEMYLMQNTLKSHFDCFSHQLCLIKAHAS